MTDINNIHTTLLLVFFSFAESLQLNRVCPWIDAVQVLLKVFTAHQHCTLSHRHLSMTYVKLSHSMAGEFINRHEPCKNHDKKHHPVGPARKEVLHWMEGTFSLLQHLHVAGCRLSQSRGAGCTPMSTICLRTSKPAMIS